MILFDYGQTLVNKKKFDGIAGTRAVLQYVTKNKYNRTAEEVQAAAEVINVELGRFDPKRRHLNQIEVPNHMRGGIQIQKVYRYKQRQAFPKCPNRQFSENQARYQTSLSPDMKLRIFQMWSNMWSKAILDQSRGEVKKKKY